MGCPVQQACFYKRRFDLFPRNLDIRDVEIEFGEFGTGDNKAPMTVGFGVFAGRAVREEAVTGSPDSVSVVA